MKTIILDPEVWDDLAVLPAAALVDVIDTYMSSSLALLAEARHAAATENIALLRERLHQLKESSATLGVRSLAERCAALEQRLEDRIRTNIPATLGVLEVTHAQGAYALGKRRAALLDRPR